MDRGKAEVFSAFFASMFNTDDRGRSQCSELDDHDCKKDKLSAVPELTWDLLLQLDP